MYTLQAPSKEDEEWYEEQRRQVIGSAEFDPDGTMATIDIRRCKSYLRLLKDSSLPTLDAALGGDSARSDSLRDEIES